MDIVEKLLELISAGNVVFWHGLASFLLVIILLLILRTRRTQKKLTIETENRVTLEKRLLIEHDAHEETKRELEIKIEGLRRTAESIRNLREDLKKSELELSRQTEEVIALQDWKRSLEREKNDLEKERVKAEKLQQRKDEISTTIYKYYDDFSREIFSCLDNDLSRGTYHHIQTVATLAGLAAERIKLSPSFVRAAAYIHDIGKCIHPKYFKENWSYNEDKGWRQENEDYSFYHRGKRILSHLPLGRKIVNEQLKTPPSDLMEMLADFPGSHEWKQEIFHDAVKEMSSSIEEHQGNTSILGLFRASVINGEGTSLDDFKYTTGRNPTSKANGIILLADSSDAAFEAISIDKNVDIANVIRNVFFLKISLGLLDETGLTIREFGQIYNVFVEFFSQKYKIGDRIEEKQHEERIFYKESKVNPIGECIEIINDLSSELIAKRKVAYYFAFQSENIYKLKQVNKLVELLLSDLATTSKDDIYLANIIKALRAYIHLSITDLLSLMEDSGVVLENEMKVEDLTLADLFEVPGMRMLMRSDNRCEEAMNRLILIKNTVIEAIVNKDILNKTDQYIYDEGLYTYHWLSRQNKINDPLEAGPEHKLTPRDEHLSNEWITLDLGQKMVRGVRGKIIEILPVFRLNNLNFERITFNAYFKSDTHYFADTNDLFRTRDKKIAAIHAEFISTSQEDGKITGIPLNFPLSELHCKESGITEISVHIQICRLDEQEKQQLLLDHEESIKNPFGSNDDNQNSQN